MTNDSTLSMTLQTSWTYTAYPVWHENLKESLDSNSLSKTTSVSCRIV